MLQRIILSFKKSWNLSIKVSFCGKVQDKNKMIRTWWVVEIIDDDDHDDDKDNNNDDDENSWKFKWIPSLT